MFAAFAFAAWGAHEADHLARYCLGVAPAGGAEANRAAPHLGTAIATATSAAWVLESALLLMTSWMRRSAFLRWCALALLGVTLLKFVCVDLATVDGFWRFPTSIAVGEAMLGLSFAYQSRARKERPRA